MKAETDDLIREIMERMYAVPVPVSWRSNQVIPSGGDRRSHSRGSDGFDIMAWEEYESGDNPRDIDWIAFAQTGGQTLYTTQYMETRELKVFVLVDTARTMDFGTVRTTKRLLAAELAATVIHSAEKVQDKAGFIAYSEHGVEEFMPASSASRTLWQALEAIVESGSTANDGTSGLIEALELLPGQKCMLFIVSDFLNFTDDEKAALKGAAAAHDVIALVVNDKREKELPKMRGMLTLVDVTTGRLRTIFMSKRTRARYARNFERHMEALSTSFADAYCDWSAFSTEEDGEAVLLRLAELCQDHKR